MAEASALAVATPKLLSDGQSRDWREGAGVRHSRVLQHQDGPLRRTVGNRPGWCAQRSIDVLTMKMATPRAHQMKERTHETVQRRCMREPPPDRDCRDGLASFGCPIESQDRSPCP